MVGSFVLDKGNSLHSLVISDVSDNDELDNWQDNDVLIFLNLTSLFKYLIAANNGYDNSVIFCVVREGLLR